MHTYMYVDFKAFNLLCLCQPGNPRPVAILANHAPSHSINVNAAYLDDVSIAVGNTYKHI